MTKNFESKVFVTDFGLNWIHHYLHSRGIYPLNTQGLWWLMEDHRDLISHCPPKCFGSLHKWHWWKDFLPSSLACHCSQGNIFHMHQSSGIHAYYCSLLSLSISVSHCTMLWEVFQTWKKKWQGLCYHDGSLGKSDISMIEWSDSCKPPFSPEQGRITESFWWIGMLPHR